MDITAGFIPHRQFHEGIWLIAEERPEWYYFMRKSNPNSIKVKGFINSVDAPLKKLVRYLHRRKLKTTPSCSGHKRGERNYDKIYDALLLDQKDIRTKGLRLKNVETGKVYIYKNKNYKLPWGRRHFLQRAANYQLNGVLGIKTGKSTRLRKKLLQMEVEEVKVEEKDGVVLILTTLNDELDGWQVWGKINTAVRKALRKAK